MKGLRAFEMFVIALVLGVTICFIIQLSLIKNTSVGEVFRGYLPSSAIVQPQGYVTTLLSLSNMLIIADYIKHALFSERQSCHIVST